MNLKFGKLIVIEGIDGSGKATQSKLLYDSLKELGHDVIHVDFPNYDKPASGAVKMLLDGAFETWRTSGVSKTSYAMQISSLYSTDRLATFMSVYDNGKTLFERFYLDGAIIICDRYTPSSILYQSRFIGTKYIREFQQWIEDLEYNQLKLPKPDSVIYLSVNPTVSLQNLDKRYEGQNKNDLNENKETLEAVYDISNLIVGMNSPTWKKIECTDESGTNMLPIESISKQILETTLKIIKDE